MRAIPFLLILVSCVVPGTTRQETVEPNNSIVAITSKCVDTLRSVIGVTHSIPPRYFYRDEAFFFQIRAEIDLRVHDLFPDSIAVVALTPDDSLSFHILRWKEAIDVSPSTATFSFLVKTTKKGMAYFKIAGLREREFTRREIRAAGVSASF